MQTEQKVVVSVYRHGGNTEKHFFPIFAEYMKMLLAQIYIFSLQGRLCVELKELSTHHKNLNSCSPRAKTKEFQLFASILADKTLYGLKGAFFNK